MHVIIWDEFNSSAMLDFKGKLVVFELLKAKSILVRLRYCLNTTRSCPARNNIHLTKR